MFLFIRSLDKCINLLITRTLQDKEPSEPVATTITSQPESSISEAKKEEVVSLTETSTIKPSHNKDARFVSFFGRL